MQNVQILGNPEIDNLNLTILKFERRAKERGWLSQFWGEISESEVRLELSLTV